MNYLLPCLLMSSLFLQASSEITPEKVSPKEFTSGAYVYNAPLSARFTIPRAGSESDIVYYHSVPNDIDSYPIAILCTGSSSRDAVSSIIHFHRYFLKEFNDMGFGAITIEQQGVDGNAIDVDEFMHHYTRSARLSDHEQVINYLIENPPARWDGKFCFLGVSEGGPIVTTLTMRYPSYTIATLNWVGAGDYSWKDELWEFIDAAKRAMPWYVKCQLFLCTRLPKWMPFSIEFPYNKKILEDKMIEMINNPSINEEYLGMTYKYHADTANDYPKNDYSQIKTPFLVVSGGKDSGSSSCVDFVSKAKAAGAPIIYWSIPEMGHYIRKRPDVIEKSFDWLQSIVVDS